MTVETRDRIVAAGRELFTRHGFGQVGLDQVVQQASLTKTTFYNHFESKEQLIREVLDLQEEEIREQLQQGVDRIGGGDSRRRLLAIFDVLSDILATPLSGSQLMVYAAAEYPNEHDPIRQAVSRNKKALDQLILQLAQEAGATDAEELAGQLSHLYHGAILHGMLGPDKRQGPTYARQAADLLVNAVIK